MTARKPTLLSIFSGVGGMDLGLEEAGFRVVGAVENDPIARRSLKANRSRWPILEAFTVEDVAASLEPEDLGLERRGLTLLAGAPPCQPYSKAAMWNHTSWTGFEDPRAKPLLSFLELAETLLPRAVLLENVPGFVSGPHSVEPVLRDAFAGINGRTGSTYQVTSAVLNAAAFGVPQRRKRAIVVAFRDGAEMAWPAPSHIETPIRAWDALHDIKPEDPPSAAGRWADLLPSIPEGENYLWHTPRGGGLSLFGYRTRYWSFLLKLARDQPSWTLPAQPGPSVGPFHWDNRPLDASEMLRLQSFPADWIVEGTRREQVRQAGNATPPLLAEVVGRAILGVLDEKRFRREPRLAIQRAESVPPPAAPKRVLARYRDLIDEHPDHPGSGAGPKPRSERITESVGAESLPLEL